MRLVFPITLLLLAQTMIHGPSQVRDIICGNAGQVTSDDGAMVVQHVSAAELTFCPRCTVATPGTFRFNELVGQITNSWSCRVTEVTSTGAVGAYVSLIHVGQPAIIVNYYGPITLECDRPFVTAVKAPGGDNGFQDYSIPIAMCVGSGVNGGFTNCVNYTVNTAIW